MEGPGPYNRILGALIRREREAAGLSQAAAAEAIGRSARWQTKAEQGGCYLRVEDVEQMRAWGLDVHATLAEARIEFRRIESRAEATG